MNTGTGFMDLNILMPEAVNTINLYSYELALSKPLIVKGHVLKVRQGIIFEIITAGGTRSCGEISPLPHFSSESFKDAAAQAKLVRDMILNRHKKTRQKPGPKTGGLLPSVRNGLEMAVFNLGYINSLKKNTETPGSQKTLNPGQRILRENVTPVLYLPLNGLISFRAKATQDEMQNEAARIIKEGYKTVKVKVGRQSVDDDISMIAGLCNIFNGGLRLRLDSNCSWSLNEALHFGRKISQKGIDGFIEYIEDPLKNLEDLHSFYEQTGIPVALDETIEEFENKYGRFACSSKENFAGGSLRERDKTSFPFLKAIIIKPTIVGGFYRSEELIDYCRRKSVTPVLSSTFETGLGISSIVLFAKAQGLLGIAAGLDTLNWFKSDIINGRLSVKDGKLCITEAEKALTDIDFNKLVLLD